MKCVNASDDGDINPLLQEHLPELFWRVDRYAGLLEALEMIVVIFCADRVRLAKRDNGHPWTLCDTVHEHEPARTRSYDCDASNVGATVRRRHSSSLVTHAINDVFLVVYKVVETIGDVFPDRGGPAILRKIRVM